MHRDGEPPVRLNTSTIDERVVRLNKNITVMANFLKMNLKFMPWLGKMIMGPDRCVSVVEEDACVRQNKGVTSLE